MNTFTDTYNRVHNYLRISLTDKCNLHCAYCNPAALQHLHTENKEILSYEELYKIIHFFVSQYGITKIRLTGGEPFARRNVIGFIKSLSELKKYFPFHLGITTNGTLLYEHLVALRNYNVDSLNISLDSLQENNFQFITQKNFLTTVLKTIHKAKELQFPQLKINTVVLRGVNNSELLDFTKFAAENEINVRFIEFMPFTNNQWNNSTFVSYKEMLEEIQARIPLSPINLNANNISKDYRINNTNGIVSFISSVSEHFCGGCNRLRITAQGKLKTCLFSTPEHELDLKTLLRSEQYSNEILAEKIQRALLRKWFQHPEVDELAEMRQNSMLAIGG